MIQMLPGYTLERLQETDIDLLLPLYFWYAKQQKKELDAISNQIGGEPQQHVVYRDGKPYVVKTADQVKVF
jgi:hypothetical protein